MADALYKIARPDGSAANGGSGKWRLNRWRGVRGELVPCENGLHLCRVRDLPRWVVSPGLIWRCEHEGERIDCDDKVVVRRARPVERVGKIDDRIARLFACWCVRHTPLGDGRAVWDLLTDEWSRNVVEVAERYAVGEATAEELTAARSSEAYAVSAYATESAWWKAAARSVVWSAAWSAARSAAVYAAEYVVEPPAWSAACQAQGEQLLRMAGEDDE